VADYKVLIEPSAALELEQIPKKDRQQLVLKITRLVTNPRPCGCQKLSGTDDYRIRQGDYRLMYSIDEQEKTVRIFKVAHRKMSVVTSADITERRAE
jgi:mRNA interferase RelE/StbE